MNIQEAFSIIEENGMNLEFLPNEFKDDQNLVLYAINSMEKMALFSRENLPCPLQFASDRLRNDYEIVSRAIEICGGDALMYASENLKDDADLVKIAVKQNPTSLKFSSERVRAHKPTVLFTIKLRGRGCYGPLALEFASHALQQDPEIIAAASHS